MFGQGINLYLMHKKLLFSFCFFLFLSSLIAQRVVTGPEPSWLYKIKPDTTRKVNRKMINNGYYLSLLDLQTDISSQTDYYHFIRNIINESGVQNASEVSVSFAPQYQKVIFHKIDLIRDGKVVSHLSGNQIKVIQEETDATNYQYNELNRAIIVLKDVRTNDQIDIAYSIKGDNPVFDGKFSSDIYFTQSTAVVNFYQTIISTDKRPLLFKRFNNAPAPTESKNNGSVIYHWNNVPVTPVEVQNNVPSWFNNYPHVSITEYQNWGEIVRWGNTLFNHYSYLLPEAVKKKIILLRSEANGNRYTFITLATRFVQDQIRYLGYEIGVHTHKPHDPGNVFKQRFGDCKDKALLLTMILREEKIPAYVALVNTDYRHTLNEQQPSPLAFNHVIVAIDDSSSYQFIDPTISYQRGDLAGLYIPAYGRALILREGMDHLEEVKPGYKKSTDIVETFTITKKNVGSALLKVESTFEGASADIYRNTLADNSVSEMERQFQNYYRKFYDSVLVEKDIVALDDSIANIITIKENYSIPEIWREDENGKKSFHVVAKPIYQEFPDPAASYKFGPLAINYPQNFHYRIILNMPEKWSFPKDQLHIRNESYVFDFNVITEDKTIILDYTFITYKDNISAEELVQYKSDYKKICSVLEYVVHNNSFSNLDANRNGNTLNWPLVGLMVVVIIGSCLLIQYLNKQEVETYIPIEEARRLGGWVSVAGVVIVINIIGQLYYFISDLNLKSIIWESLKSLGGYNLQALMMVTIISRLFLFIAVSMLFYWYIKRRDIFPKMFICYLLCSIVINLFLYFWYSNSGTQQLVGDDVGKAYLSQLTRSFVFGICWTLYFTNSSRVKNTFLYPYNYKPVTENPVLTDEKNGSTEHEL